MAERSAAALHWLVVTLVLWGLARLFPPTGARRKAPTAMGNVVTSANVRDHACQAVGVPAQRRSPYSTDHAPLDGSTSPLSRPYLPAVVAYAPEPRAARVRPYSTSRERVLKWRRRRVLVLAAHFRLDLDTRNIHTIPAPVGGGVR